MSDFAYRTTKPASAGRMAATGDGVAAGIGTWTRSLARRFRSRQTERALMSLSDTALKDIGVSRSDIKSIAFGFGGVRRGR